MRKVAIQHKRRNSNHGWVKLNPLITEDFIEIAQAFGLYTAYSNKIQVLEGLCTQHKKDDLFPRYRVMLLQTQAERNQWLLGGLS